MANNNTKIFFIKFPMYKIYSDGNIIISLCMSGKVFESITSPNDISGMLNNQSRKVIVCDVEK